MKRKIIAVFFCFVLLNTLVTSQAWGFCFHKKQKPIINQKEKLEYVNMGWWSKFCDPCLNYYIETAVTNNHDARKASFTVEEYRQFVKYQFGQELPSLSVGANYLGAHLPGNMSRVLSQDNVFLIPFTANYQADIFLKNRDKTKSKQKDYEANKYQEKATYISLASNVATVYVNIIKYDKKIQIQKRIVSIKQEELVREKSKFTRGVSTMLKVNELEKSLETAKNDLENLDSARTKALTQLAVLTGDSPENIANYKRTPFDKFELRTKAPREIASDVIFSRPDIMQKETLLEKSKIDIRVARKDFLPTINISASYIFSNLGAGNFFNWDSAIASILAGASQDLFKGGMKFANLRIYKTRYEEMFEDYRQTDLKAIKEVHDSLVLIENDTSVDENLNKNLAVQGNSYKRVSHSYLNGVVAYPNLLSEREKLFMIEQSKVDAKSVKLIDYITLYNAVGGKL